MKDWVWSINPIDEAEVKEKLKWAIFDAILNRTRILIHSNAGDIIRDLRDEPYSTGVTYYGRSGLGWWSAVVLCDDVETPEAIDAKADVLFAMYYAEHNPEDAVNHWGDVPVVIVDGCFHGSYAKEVLVDGNSIFKRRGAFWLHYNLKTGQAGAF